VTTSSAPDGSRVYFVHNWSWTPATLTAPAQLSDLISGSALDQGSTVELGAWDVRVFTDSAAE